MRFVLSLTWRRDVIAADVHNLKGDNSIKSLDAQRKVDDLFSSRFLFLPFVERLLP